MTGFPLGLWLDLVGTFVFGLSGGMLAVRQRLDVFGVAVLALAAATAGGILRDVLLGATPPAAFVDPRYLLAALAAGGTAFFAHRVIARMDRPVMVLDAMGLGLFAVAGSLKALASGLGVLPAILMGVVSAVGGGALRDLLVAQVPRVLREEVYALAALVGAVVVVAGSRLGLPELVVAVTGVVVTFSVRVLSVWLGWQAPRPPGS